MNKRLFLMMVGLVMALSYSMAADRLIKGTVIASEDNSPLIGASVYITPEDLKKAGVGNTPIGVITDIDGNFAINVPSGINRIYCSFVGYDVKEVELLNNKKQYEVVLHPSSVMMDGVVVTGYQTLERRKLTAAVSKVDMSEERIGAARSIDQALAGQVAGLSVMSTTGAPGAPAKIRIRGTASMNGTQDPLWVLDGIPLEGTDIPDLEKLSDISSMEQSSIAGLSPSDIEDITILKDAAATAIYGARAANGVIVITTKKGKVGKPQINFSAKLTYSPTLNYDKLNLLNSDQKVDLELDLIRYNLSSEDKKGGVFGILSANNDLQNYWSKGMAGLSPESVNAINRLRTINTDWSDVLFRDVFNQEYNINLSGGTDRVTYYTSFGYSRENGNVTGVSMDRFNFVGKTTYKVNRMLKVGASIFANRRSNKNYLSDPKGLSNPIYYSRRANPYNQLYDADGNYIYDFDIQNDTNRDLAFNIFEERTNTSNEGTISAVSTIFDAELKIVDQFKLTTQFGYQMEKNSREEIADWDTFTMRDKNFNTVDNGVHYLPKGGMQKNYENSNSQITWKAMAEYKDVYRDDHELELMLGTELRRNWYETLYSAGYGFDRKTLKTKPILFPTESEAIDFGPLHSTSFVENAFASFFATASYSYLNRYTLGGSIRFDGSDLFGVDKKYRFLPLYSVSALWRLSHEPFMKNANWIDNLAVRVSYGLQGNIDKNTSPYLIGQYDNISILPGFNEDALNINSAPNNKLRWEKTASVNAGFDFSVLHQAINLSVDYYYRKGTDLIGAQMLPLESGFPMQTINWASMKNEGVEIALNTRNITAKDFSWYTTLNFAYNNNKVLQEVTREDDFNPSRVGYPVNAIFAYKTAGVDPETGNMLFMNKEGKAVSLVEFFKADDFGGSALTTAEQRELFTYIGSADAPYTGGFINTFTYKNWELSVNFSLTLGGYVRTAPTYNNLFPEYGKNSNADILNRWTPENTAGTMPGILKSPYDFDGIDYPVNQDEFFYYSWGYRGTTWSDLDIWVKKLNYARLQNLRLSYRIPETFLKKLGVRGATVALEGRNLFVIGSGYNNYMDPESMYNPYATPVPKSAIFSLNLNF